MFKNSDKKRITSANIKFVAIGIGVLGIVLYLVSIVIDVFSDGNSIYKFVIELLPLVGSILITYAISSVLIDFFAFGEYLKILISRLFTEYDMLNILSDKEKRVLRHNIILTDLKYSNSDCDEFVDFVDQEIDDSINNIYYKDFVETVDIDIEGDMIKKTIIKDVTIDDIAKKNNSFEDLLSNQFVPSKIENPITIKLIKIDDKELNFDGDKRIDGYYLEEKSIHNNGSYTYSCRYKLSKPIIIEKETHLKLIYETKVPINDLIFQIKSQYMCKSMKIICKTTNKDLELNAMSFNLSSKTNGFDISNIDKNTIEISSKKWLFAGEGIVINIVK